MLEPDFFVGGLISRGEAQLAHVVLVNGVRNRMHMVGGARVPRGMFGPELAMGAMSGLL